MIMSTVDYSPVYVDLVELLAASAKPEQVLAFQMSDEKQLRLDDLLSKNRDQTLSPQESAELDAFEQFEHWSAYSKHAFARSKARDASDRGSSAARVAERSPLPAMT